MTTELSWTPVKRGNIYCSTACGGNCTYKDYSKAVERTVGCIKLLGAKNGWKPFIHENLGWHSQVYNGPVTISCNSDDTFTCYVANQSQVVDKYYDWDESYWSYRGEIFNDPVQALLFKAELIQKFYEGFRPVVDRMVYLTRDLQDTKTKEEANGGRSGT